ncbi:helical backbone metal receptor [Roseateles terrae]|uniref:ABC-type Fe3+-hydroxamate transport system substrate-binding protein n=1 Tax=Roseateles terrae TaxID=431060 RepID=A0ABR6GXT9_9BURK|nr:helical backbone metal receptor [Roseateles terrae]MBB3196922.1 ABC-type Fe3+-hydroxamate transport system substrate-binding protein [Roseateles terrae]
MIRIISLVPSITELLFALGLGPQVVGRTGFCTHPPKGVREIPKIGGTKDLNLERIRALLPTHVIVNVDENRLEDVAALRQTGAEIVVTHPCSPQDNLPLLAQMVSVFAASQPQVQAQAERLAQQLRQELAACQAGAWTRRRVLYLIWRDPWMTVAQDTYIARMLAEVGWRTWPPQEGGPSGAARYPVLTGQEPWLQEIEEVLLSSEPYRFDERHMPQAQALCPNARVRLVDGELISWYGPRAAEGLAYLRSLAAA